MQLGTRSLGIVAALASLVAHPIWAQWDLANLYTNTVKQNQPWAQINTRLDEVVVDIEVRGGVVTTSVQCAFTPDSGLVQDRVVISPTGEKVIPEYEKVFLDSLESAAWFQLAANTAIQELFLWVDGEKVRGELQERGLASAQYESIVQRRRDPAILETYGNGNYNLRVFPLETGKQRRIEIQFRQGLENEGAGFSASLPILFSEGRVYTMFAAGAQDAQGHERAIGSLQVSARSSDGKTYRLEWEGLGALTLGPQVQTLAAQKVTKLGIGRVTDNTPCTGCPSAWTGTRAGQSYFGFKTLLERSNLTFDPEPANRMFLLDVPEEAGAEEIERAKKLALMAIKTYAEGRKFQLGFTGDQGQVQFAFSEFVELNPSTLQTAYEALSGYSGSPAAASHAVLRSMALPILASSVAKPVPSAILLFSGHPAPSYPIDPPVVWNIDNQDQWSVFWDGYNSWNQDNLKTYENVAETLLAAGINLFGFFDDYYLGHTAIQTGGFQHGSLQGGYYYWYRPFSPAIDAASTIGSQQPAGAQWYLPPLYGPGRPGNPGPQNLEVATSGVPVDNLALLWQPQWYYGFPGGIVDPVMPEVMAAEPAALRKTSLSIAPCCFGQMDSADIRLSGTYASPGALTAVFTGTWGGLGFSKSVTVSLGTPIPANGASAIWAYQKSEALHREDYLSSVETIKQLGFGHHIVNSQVSLLALEPGMELWTELPNPQTAGENVARNASESIVSAPFTDASISSTGNALTVDDWSLEDILNGTSPVQPVSGKSAGTALSARAAGAVRIALVGIADGEKAVFELIDVRGRVLAKLEGISRSGRVEVEWTPPAGIRGVLMIQARFSGRVEVGRVVLPGNGR